MDKVEAPLTILFIIILVSFLLALNLTGILSIPDTQYTVLLSKLEYAKKKLESRLDMLRVKGIQIKQVYINKTIMALTVVIANMKLEYTGLIRDIVGYEVPVLFYEPQVKIILGKPPAPVEKLKEEAKRILLSEYTSRIAIESIEVDEKRGLIHIRLWAIIEEYIEAIRKAASPDTPILIEKIPWIPSRMRLYIGKPGLLSMHELKSISQRVQALWGYLIKARNVPLTALGLQKLKENNFYVLYVGLHEIKYEYIRTLREIVGYKTPLIIEKVGYLKELTKPLNP